MKLNFHKLDIEIPVEIPVNFMILTGTGIPANRLILTGTGILPGSRSILGHPSSHGEYDILSLGQITWRLLVLLSPTFIFTSKNEQKLYKTDIYECCQTEHVSDELLYSSTVKI